MCSEFYFKTILHLIVLVLVAAVVVVVVVAGVAVVIAFEIVGVEAFLVRLRRLGPLQIVLVAAGAALPQECPERKGQYSRCQKIGFVQKLDVHFDSVLINFVWFN